jgi:3D (Asp-Asp-Asp) domain-containing protein
VYRLIRAALAAALILLVVNLGSGALAFDPSLFVHRHREMAARPGESLRFTATAYCQPGITRSGVDTHSGIAAGDPLQLPVGSVVQIDTSAQKYTGIYTVLDTGTKVQGHHVDLFMHDCGEANRFGKQPVQLTVLRKGWSPKATAPRRLVARLAGI